MDHSKGNIMSENQGQPQEHQRLVKALIEELKRQGFEITNANCEGYEVCQEVENQVPDVKAYNRKKEYVVFGQAKTCDELDNEQTETQFKLFSSRYMAKGKVAGKIVPFCIAIPKGCEEKLEACLLKLKLNQKKNIFLFAF